MKISLVHSLPQPEKNIYIYALCEPGTNDIRYIGLATNGFDRIKQHWKTGYKLDPNKVTNVKKWISDLRKAGKIFNVVYLEYFDTDGSHVDYEEIFYISYMQSLGFKLLNHTLGGRREFLAYTDAQRKQREVNKTDEAKQFFSEKAKEQWAQPGFKEEMKKIHQTYRDDEYKKGIAKTLSDKVGVKIQDDLGNIYNSGQECAVALGVKKPNIYRALRVGYKVKGRILTYVGGGRKEFKTKEKPKRLTGTNIITRVPIEDSNGIIYETFKDAAKKLGVSESHVNKILKTGEISSILGISLKRLPKVKIDLGGSRYYKEPNDAK